MANNDARIVVDPRRETGKGAAREARRRGRIPGVVYGHGEESVSISVDASDLQRLVQSISVENTIVDLKIAGSKKPYKVLIRELQRHPFRDDLVHVDFFHIAMDEKLSVEVPIFLEGVPTGVKDRGGVVDHQLRELEVYCLPTNIPEKIVVDVTDLDIGDAMHVRDIELPDVEVQTDLERPVVAVLAPKVIEEPVEEELEEELAEPELVGREEEEEVAGESGEQPGGAESEKKE